MAHKRYPPVNDRDAAKSGCWPDATIAFSEPRTAAEIARMLSLPGNPVSRQAINKRLGGVAASVVIQVRGNATNAWTWDALPGDLRNEIQDAVAAHQYRDAETLWLRPPASPWQPSIPRSEIATEEWQRADNLRTVLLPVLKALHDSSQTADEQNRQIVENYAATFGQRITPDYGRKLLARTLKHDSGREAWNELIIYLPDSPRRRPAAPLPCTPVEIEQAEPGFPHLAAVLQALRAPSAPGKPMAQTIWKAACRDLAAFGETEPGPALVKQVCDLIYEHAPHLCRSRALYPKQLNRKLRLERDGGDASRDGRRENGQRVEIPARDIDFLRASAAFMHGGRLDEAWYEEYEQLSGETRERYSRTWRTPTRIRNLVNPELVADLYARHQGKKYLKRRTGYVKRRADSIPVMHSAAMDDLTMNIEVEHPDAPGTLIQPQLIVCQDWRSRKIIGWAVAPVKGPNAELVCAAALDAFTSVGVPHNLWLENGQVFGAALLVNGKSDDQGRTVVAGLSAYGCKIRHFEAGNPTSKGELEKTFDLLQRRLEPHPGYTGRLQQLDAPDDFKSEGVEIRSGRAAASKHRYTWAEFCEMFRELISKFNHKRQRGALAGLSPNDAFDKFQDASNPPIHFAPELRWLLANARYRVKVKSSGVRFIHCGKAVCVRGSPLPDHIGKELWALVDRQDDTVVTFMNLDFTGTPFSLEVCRETDRDESATSPGSGVLAAERRKIADATRTIETEYRRLEAEFGNPRQTLLQQRRNASRSQQSRQMIVPPELARAGEIMEEQRAEIREQRNERAASADAERRKGQALQRRARALYEAEQQKD